MKKKDCIIYSTIIILIVVLVTINILNYNKITICKYTVTDKYYSADITLNISRKETIINRQYQFNNHDILNLEKEFLINEKFKIDENNLNLTAKKIQKTNDYYKEIDKYQKDGFVCK